MPLTDAESGWLPADVHVRRHIAVPLASVNSVEDDGPGIEPDDIPHVFDRFYTVSRAAKRHVGSGLGLAIVHELVDAMGGTVRAEAGASGGARLVVSLRPGAEADAA